MGGQGQEANGCLVFGLWIRMEGSEDQRLGASFRVALEFTPSVAVGSCHGSLGRTPLAVHGGLQGYPEEAEEGGRKGDHDVGRAEVPRTPTWTGWSSLAGDAERF